MPVLFWFLPAAIAGLGAAFKWVIATAIGMLLVRAVVALGVGFVTYIGFDYALDWFLTRIKSEVGALGPVADILGMLGFDVGISLIFSGVSIAMAWTAMKGAVRKLVFL